MNGLTDTLIGIVLAIIASVMFTAGVIGQKKAVEGLPEIKMTDLKTITPMLKHRIWLIGTIIAILGGLPYIASQAFIGIGYTQLLMAVGLIFMAYCAVRILKEKLGALEWAGISCILAGTILLGLAQLSDVQVDLATPRFFMNVLIFYIVFGSLIAAGLIVYKLTSWAAAKNMAINSGIWFGIGACSSQIGTLGLEEWNLLVAGVGFFILMVGNAVGTLVVNVAFQKGKAVMIVPLQSAGNYLIPVFAGLILFQQTFKHAFFFWPSLVCIMGGVFLLSRIQAEMEKPVEESDIEEENPSIESQ